jgi:hypothetical protein
MVWQKIDDQFGVSKKVMRIPRARRQRCAGLWLLALNASGRYSTNGLLESGDLAELDARMVEVDELVRVRLWHRNGHDCARCEQPDAGGIVIHDFLDYNPDAGSVAAGQQSLSEGGKHGNHVRWHAKRHLIVAGCEWCESPADRLAIASASQANPPSPSPVPSPEKKTDLTHLLPVSPDPTAQAELDDPEFMVAVSDVGIRDLPRVIRALERVVGPLLPSIAVDTARAVILLATKPVRSVEAYVEAACVNSPEQVTGEWRRVFDASPKAAA